MDSLWIFPVQWNENSQYLQTKLHNPIELGVVVSINLFDFGLFLVKSGVG